jgi:hypothetical protein
MPKIGMYRNCECLDASKHNFLLCSHGEVVAECVRSSDAEARSLCSGLYMLLDNNAVSAS